MKTLNQLLAEEADRRRASMSMAVDRVKEAHRAAMLVVDRESTVAYADLILQQEIRERKAMRWQGVGAALMEFTEEMKADPDDAANITVVEFVEYIIDSITKDAT